MSFFSRTSHPFADVFQSPFFLLEPFVDASQAHNNVIPNKRGNQNVFNSSGFFNGPRCDLHATESEFILEAEIPGIPKEQIKLEVDEKARKITISGEVKTSYSTHQHQDDDHSKHQSSTSTEVTKTETNDNKQVGQAVQSRTLISERSYGKIQRTWILREKADLTKVKAKINDGILKVNIPFHTIEKVTPRSVTIEDANDE